MFHQQYAFIVDWKPCLTNVKRDKAWKQENEQNLLIILIPYEHKRKSFMGRKKLYVCRYIISITDLL